MRIWIDTMAASFLTKEDFERLISEGNICVIANTALDVTAFQKHPQWFEQQLQNGSIIIEIWITPDEMVRKPFYWSSCALETQPADKLEEAVKNLPNASGIIALSYLVDLYGIPKGKWPMGPWSAPEPLSEADATALGLDVSTATRTDVLAAARKADCMDVFNAYNFGYCKGLAVQHCCDAIVNSDGTYTCL